MFRELGIGQGVNVNVVVRNSVGRIEGEKVGGNGKHIVVAGDTWTHLRIVVSLVGTATRVPSNPHILI